MERYEVVEMVRADLVRRFNGDFNDDGVVWNGNGVVEIGVGVFENVWGVLEKSDFGVSLWCFWSGFCDCDVKNG